MTSAAEKVLFNEEIANKSREMNWDEERDLGQKFDGEKEINFSKRVNIKGLCRKR